MAQPRTSPVARRTKIGPAAARRPTSASAMSSPPSRCSLSDGESVALDRAATVELDDGPLQVAGLVGAPGIDRQGAPEPRRAPRLVDVAVQAEDRLRPLDRLAHCRRADVREHAPPADDAEILGELRRLVERRSLWRAVEVEDQPLGR